MIPWQRGAHLLDSGLRNGGMVWGIASGSRNRLEASVAGTQRVRGERRAGQEGQSPRAS